MSKRYVNELCFDPQFFIYFNVVILSFASFFALTNIALEIPNKTQTGFEVGIYC